MSERKTPADGLGRGVEAEGRNTPFDKYLDQRFKDPNSQVFKASSLARKLGRELTLSEQTDYRQSVEASAATLTQTLEIDPSLFGDPRYAEIFLAICDSWAANEQNRTGETYEAERDFLFQTTRMLTGSKSKYNLARVERGEEGANLFVKVAAGHETQTEKSVREFVVQMVENANTEMTERVKRACFDIGDDTIFAPLRTFLSETPDEMGSTWDIIVVKESAQEQFHAKGFGAIGAFITTYNGKRLLVYPETKARDLLSPEDTKDRQAARKLFAHEMTHVLRERDIMVGDEGGTFSLGIVTNEHAAFFVEENFGKIGQYFNLAQLFSWMSRTYYVPGEGDRTQRDFDRTFLSALREKHMERYFQFVSDNFGFRSLLFLTAFRNSAYDRLDGFFGEQSPINPDGLQDVQQLRRQYSSYIEPPTDENRIYALHARDAAVTHTLLTEAVRIRPEALQTLREFISNAHGFATTMLTNQLVPLITGYPDFLVQLLREQAEIEVASK